MAHYLLSVYPPAAQDQTLGEAAMQQLFKDIDAFNERLQASGSFVFAGGLHDASSATVVRKQGGTVMTTDGPFLEVKEHVGGFYVIEAADLDAALRWGTEAATACQAAIEVRPFDGIVE
jgi:hypothetical protein